MYIFRKSISIGLSLALLATLASPVFAEGTEQILPISAPVVISATDAATSMPRYLKDEAVVKSVLANDQLLVIINKLEVALNVSAETLVLDAKTGLMANLKDVKVGDLLFVYYSPAMTRSLPPQSFATAIITNIIKDQARPALFNVKEVVSSSDKEVRVLNEEGDLIATISKDTPLFPFKTKQIITIKDIEVGTQLFIWYEVVASSYPGQTQVQKAIYVGQTDLIESPNTLGVEPVTVPSDSKFTEKISINGKIIDLGKQKWYADFEKQQTGIVMVPLRVVAEALGFKVSWDNQAKAAMLDDGNVKTTVALGRDGYYLASSKAIGLTQSFKFGAEPVLVNGSMYAPVQLFNLLYSDNEAVKIIK